MKTEKIPRKFLDFPGISNTFRFKYIFQVFFSSWPSMAHDTFSYVQIIKNILTTKKGLGFSHNNNMVWSFTQKVLHQVEKSQSERIRYCDVFVIIDMLEFGQ